MSDHHLLTRIRFDDLIERETVRRRQRIFTAAGVVMVSVTIASVLMNQARRAEQEAETRRAQVTALIDYLVSDLTERLVHYEEVGELDQGLSQALSYFGAFEADELDADTLDKYRSALIGVGRTAEARAALERKIALSELLTREEPDNIFWRRSATAIWSVSISPVSPFAVPTSKWMRPPLSRSLSLSTRWILPLKRGYRPRAFRLLPAGPGSASRVHSGSVGAGIAESGER